MAYDHARLADETTIPNTAGAIVTNGSGETTYVRVITIHNSNTTAETVKIYRVPDVATVVGTAGVTNKVFEQTFQPNETVMIEVPQPGWILEDENDTIQAVTDTASKVTISVDGGQE